MYVVEIDKIIKKPEDSIECSVCGKFKHKSNFGKIRNGSFIQTRTNCEECYNLSKEKFSKINNENRKNKSSTKYWELSRKCKELNEYMFSISVNEVIENLKKLPKEARLIITQDGYYADGKIDCEIPSCPVYPKMPYRNQI